MRKQTFKTFLCGFMAVALSAPLLWSCDDDYETVYYGCGIVRKEEGKPLSIKTDLNNILIPQKSVASNSDLRDSMRIYLQFLIQEERDSICNVEVTYAQEILTKPILPYEESTLDSIGNDPVKILKPWFAQGFINFKFAFAGSMYMGEDDAHMVNLLRHPDKDGKVMLEFRHNAFNDSRDRMWDGLVSFPIANIVKDMEKPVNIEVMYRDSRNTTKTITLTYND